MLIKTGFHRSVSYCHRWIGLVIVLLSCWFKQNYFFRNWASVIQLSFPSCLVGFLLSIQLWLNTIINNVAINFVTQTISLATVWKTESHTTHIQRLRTVIIDRGYFFYKTNLPRSAIFLIFSVVKTLVVWWILYSYSTGIAAAQLWWHPFNVEVIKKHGMYFTQSNIS